MWLDRVARKLARAPQSARVRVSRELVRAIRERSKRASELEREIGAMVRAQAPQLLELPGCGVLSAAKLLGEIAGASRFSSDAKLARLAGVAPIPASSGNRTRLRLDRGGNRQLNCAVHRIAVTQSRVHAPAREFLARKRAEGKSNREALRCLKRHLIRRVWRLLIDSEIDRSMKTVDTQRGLPVPHFAAAAWYIGEQPVVNAYDSEIRMKTIRSKLTYANVVGDHRRLHRHWGKRLRRNPAEEEQRGHKAE